MDVSHSDGRLKPAVACHLTTIARQLAIVLMLGRHKRPTSGMAGLSLQYRATGQSNTVPPDRAIMHKHRQKRATPVAAIHCATFNIIRSIVPPSTSYNPLCHLQHRTIHCATFNIIQSVVPPSTSYGPLCHLQHRTVHCATFNIVRSIVPPSTSYRLRAPRSP